MNRDEAKQTLRAFRPIEPDRNDPEFTEALKLAREDAELARWLEREATFDAAIAARLASIAPPADLREEILEGDPRRRSGAGAVWRQKLFLLAACLTVLATVAALWPRQPLAPPPPSSPLAQLAPWQTGSLAALSAVLGGHDKLDVESPNSEELRQWLAHAHSPVPAVLPKSLEHLDSVGCKTLVLNDARVSIICFHTGPTQLAHLVTVSASQLASAPPEHRPQFVRTGEWATASWSDRGQSFMLAIKGGEPELRNLLGAAG